VSRLGGDEFVAIVPDCGDPLVVGGIVETMLKRLSEPYIINDQVLHINASAGVAIAPNDGTNVDELIANADLALYQAKSDGGRICRFFLPVLRAQAQARRGLDLELRKAFAENEFELHYQAQVRLADEAVVGAEVLLRWRHPERGMVSPAEFIPIAEDTGLINEIGGACWRPPAATPRSQPLILPCFAYGISSAECFFCKSDSSSFPLDSEQPLNKRFKCWRACLHTPASTVALACLNCQRPPAPQVQTRNSRPETSARPEMPRMAITSGDERPLTFSASSAS